MACTGSTSAQHTVPRQPPLAAAAAKLRPAILQEHIEDTLWAQLGKVEGQAADALGNACASVLLSNAPFSRLALRTSLNATGCHCPDDLEHMDVAEIRLALPGELRCRLPRRRLCCSRSAC